MRLTEREKEILNKIVETDSVKTAASELDLTPSTIYNILYRIRKKQREARLFINQLLPYRKYTVLKRLLAPRLTIRELQQLTEEE